MRFFTLLILVLSANMALAQPENDLCSGAIDITDLFTPGIGEGASVGPYSNLDATGDSTLAADLVDFWFDIAPGTSEPSVDQNIWFKFTGDGNVYQIMTWNCPGSAIYSNDTQMALYTGTCDSLNFVLGNDDMQPWWGWWHSWMNFKAEEGVDYYLMIDGFNHYEGGTWEGVAQGSFCIGGIQVEPMTDHVACESSRAIDELFEATTASTPGFVGPFDDSPSGSGIEMNPDADMLGTECWTDGVDDGSVWFSWTGDGNPYTITHSQCQEGDETFVYYFAWDSQMALYKGDCGELVPIACHEDLDFDEGWYWSQIGFDSEEGETYYLRFDGYHWENQGYEWKASGAFCLRADLGNINGMEEADLTDLVIDAYPNPAANTLTLSWSGADFTADVQVFDMTGKQVASWPNVQRGSQQQFDLPNGFYTLQINTDDTAGVTRLQVLR